MFYVYEITGNRISSQPNKMYTDGKKSNSKVKLFFK